MEDLFQKHWVWLIHSLRLKRSLFRNCMCWWPSCFDGTLKSFPDKVQRERVKSISYLLLGLMQLYTWRLFGSSWWCLCCVFLDFQCSLFGFKRINFLLYENSIFKLDFWFIIWKYHIQVWFFILTNDSIRPVIMH